MLAIRLAGSKVDVLLLANLHIRNGKVKPGNHLLGAARELKWRASIVAAVELRAVVERATVVDLDLFTDVGHFVSPVYGALNTAEGFQTR